MPVLFLTGDSELSKEERVEELRREFGGEYVRIRPEDPDKLSVLRSSLNTLGMFAPRRIVDVVDLDSWKSKEKKELQELLKEVPDDVLVVIRGSKKIGDFESEEHSLPKPWEREKWRLLVGKIFEKHGLRASDEVLEYFLDLVGSDERRIASEVEKLSLYVDGEVRVSDVEEVVHRYTHLAVDELCFAISERRFADAHSMVDDVLIGSDPVIVMASLAKHFVDLTRLRAKFKLKPSYIWPDVARASKELSLPVPKVARFLGFKFKGWKFEPVNHMTLYDLEDLPGILKKIYYTDRSVKMGENPRASLHWLIESIGRDADV